MEDPANEVEGVVRALVDKPTLQRQAQTLKKFFTNDVESYHFYINTNCGLKALIAIYQMAQLFLNYSGVDFHNIVYDEARNSLAVRMTVYIRPWLLLWRTTRLHFITLLELEDVIVSEQTVKKIKVQRDYFIRAVNVQLLPIIGSVHESDTIRFMVSNTQALAIVFQVVQWMVTCLLSPQLWPSHLGHSSFAQLSRLQFLCSLNALSRACLCNINSSLDNSFGRLNIL